MLTLFQLTVVSGGVLAILLLWNIVLEWRLRRLMRGSNGKNMEGFMASIARDYQDLNDFKQSIKGEIHNLDKRIAKSTSSIGLVRFNPFAGSGTSKPSFAVAFLSEDGNGVVISTLHAHNSVSIFSKDIVNFKSEKELSQEETQALEKASNSLHT
ncbi:hypothetical protein COB52_02265 [Candidatus Kaiserbacteria bacterium]|nr:MAG: hypothetical protein COB52_02265 [Candidatus Kaiserbacteria bacterium]